MALASASGTPFDKNAVKNDGGAVLNIGDSDKFGNLNITKASSSPKNESGPVERDGDVGSTSDRAGVQKANSSQPFAKPPESNIVFGAGVNDKLSSRDYSGSLDNDATEAARGILRTSAAGSGALAGFDMFARPDAEISTGRTRPANAGRAVRFIDPETGADATASGLKPTRSNPSSLRWNFGGLPQKINFKRRDLSEPYVRVELSTDDTGQVVYQYAPFSPYPEDGIHEDAFIFEISTVPEGRTAGGWGAYGYNSPNDSFQIPTVDNGYYDCVIDWGDGTTESFVDTGGSHDESTAPEHQYSSTGIYTIKISGDFRGISSYYSGSTTDDRSHDYLKIINVSRWGTKFRFLHDNAGSSNLLPLMGWLSKKHVDYLNANFPNNWYGYFSGNQGPSSSASRRPQGVEFIPRYFENCLLNELDSDKKLSGSVSYQGAAGRLGYTGGWWGSADEGSVSGIDENGNLSKVLADNNGVIKFLYETDPDSVYTLISSYNGMSSDDSQYYRPQHRDNNFYFYLWDLEIPGTDPNKYSVDSTDDTDYSVSNSGMANTLASFSTVTEAPLGTGGLYNLSGWKPSTNTLVHTSTYPTVITGVYNAEYADFSDVTTAPGLFSYLDANRNATSPPQGELQFDVRSLDISSLTYAPGLFAGVGFPQASEGYYPLDGLDLSNVTNLQAVFYGASQIPTVSGITLGSGVNVAAAFARTSFHANGSRDVTNFVDASDGNLYHFLYLSSYNDSSTSGWNTSHITDMCGLFRQISSFNQPLNSWDVSNVTDTSHMFSRSTSFNQDLSSWDVSSVTKMQYMFQNVYSYAYNLGSWDVSNVTNMESMFEQCHGIRTTSEIAAGFANWNTSNVTNMKKMFYGQSQLAQYAHDMNIENWDVSNVTDMSEMFGISHNFNRQLNWTFAPVVNCKHFLPTGYSQPLTNWTLPVSGYGLFSVCGYFDTTMQSYISALDVSSVQGFEGWFGGNRTYSTFNHAGITSWDMSNARSLKEMFYKNRSFNQPIGSWNTSNVTDLNSMFYSDSNNSFKLPFNQDIGGWDTSNVTDMSEMFRFGLFNNGASSSISGWNTSNVTNMSYMFQQCPFNQPIGSWDVSSVTNMSYMFFANQAFNQDIGSWDVSNVTDLNSMFYSSRFNQDVGSWDTSNVTNFIQLFGVNTAFNQDLYNWSFVSAEGQNALQLFLYGASALSATNARQALKAIHRDFPSFSQNIPAPNRVNIKNLNTAGTEEAAMIANLAASGFTVYAT